MAAPSRNKDWIRDGSTGLTPAGIVQACEDSLRRLRTEVVDLYQIHWPNRNGPWFGSLCFEPTKDRACTSILQRLEVMDRLVKAGKVRAIGLSNESSWGLCEFVRLADVHGLPRVATVQYPYGLLNRVVDNGLDEAMHHSGVSLLAYSPLGAGTLTGKYDEPGFDPARPELGRIARFASSRAQRWAWPETLAAAREYNALARAHGLTPKEASPTGSRGGRKRACAPLRRQTDTGRRCREV